MVVLFCIFAIYMLVIFGCLGYMFFFDKKTPHPSTYKEYS